MDDRTSPASPMTVVGADRARNHTQASGPPVDHTHFPHRLQPAYPATSASLPCRWLPVVVRAPGLACAGRGVRTDDASV